MDILGMVVFALESWPYGNFYWPICKESYLIQNKKFEVIMGKPVQSTKIVEVVSVAEGLSLLSVIPG